MATDKVCSLVTWIGGMFTNDGAGLARILLFLSHSRRLVFIKARYGFPLRPVIEASVLPITEVAQLSVEVTSGWFASAHDKAIKEIL